MRQAKLERVEVVLLCSVFTHVRLLETLQIPEEGFASFIACHEHRMSAYLMKERETKIEHVTVRKVKFQKSLEVAPPSRSRVRGRICGHCDRRSAIHRRRDWYRGSGDLKTVRAELVNAPEKNVVFPGGVAENKIVVPFHSRLVSAGGRLLRTHLCCSTGL